MPAPPRASCAGGQSSRRSASSSPAAHHGSTGGSTPPRSRPIAAATSGGCGGSSSSATERVYWRLPAMPIAGEAMAGFRSLAATLAAAVLVPAAASAGGGSAASWAQPQIKLVIRDGLFSATPATFDGSGQLTRGALADAIARLTATAAPPAADPAMPVTMGELDSALVDALGLHDAAARFEAAAAGAGLDPPAQFGTEVAARLLGLRLDHPAAQDALELQPEQPATRAEAAYSLARILQLGTNPAASAAVAQTGRAALGFELPAMTEWQRRIVSTAVSYTGYPYVWGGTGTSTSTGSGSAGFDCSGFVWAVYKLTPYPDEGTLADTLRGRTTMQMSAEVPRSERIGSDALEPGDVMFFGRGPRSKPQQITHVAIYLG